MSMAVEMKGISKSFNGKVALDNVDFSVKKGEIHCLLGENGAGKTTLMNVLFGIYNSDAGEIKLYENKVDIKNARDAFHNGLGMVHQHFMLVENMTVLQNIILGQEIGKYKIDYSQNKNKVKEIIKKYGLEINLDEKVSNLSVGLKQRTEIIKALYRGADILVLDEPTAVLTPQEANQLMKVLIGLQKNGMTIIFITHKLNETMEIADTATILRNGELVEKLSIEDVDVKILAEKMVGHEIAETSQLKDVSKDKLIFKIDNLKLLENSTKNIFLEIHSGEILGIAGVDGNGQIELEEMIMGLRDNLEGEIFYDNKEISSMKTIELKELGIGYIPSDRFKRAILPGMNLYENMLLGNQNNKEFINNGLLKYDSIKEFTSVSLEKYNVKFSNIEQNVGGLSGGNQQKLVVSREMKNNSDFLLAAQPSRGLDIGAIQFIHEQFIQMRNNGKAILLISADLDEILKISDKIAVLYKGEIMAVDKRENFTKERLGLLMAGRRDYEKV